MSIIIACPSCGGKLRVSDKLRGQLVRCPACNHTFDSVQVPETVPPAPASEPRPVPQDLPLELAIDEPSSEPRPAPSDGTPGLFGAVELKDLKLSLDDDVPTPPRAPEPSSPEPPPRTEPPRRTPPRLSEDWDVPDIIRRRGPRRDAEPDRGGVVLTLGILSVVCLSLCGPIGLILGLVSWIMGQKDLGKMKRGDMDPRGQGMTQAGWICGIIGTVLNGLWTLACLGYIGFIFFFIQHIGTVPPRPTVQPPPPIRQWPPPPNKNPPRRIR